MKAFPNTRLMQQAVSFDNDEGMDLRDYFAGKAMQSFCWHTSPVPMEDISIRAYEMADAMMKAREQ